MEIAGVSGGTKAPTGGTRTIQDMGDQLFRGMGKDTFLKLLISQIRNQNPLDPIKNENFVAQLAQFSALEAMQQMRASIEDQARAQQVASAASLIGREIEIVGPDSQPLFGIVEAVKQQDGKVYLSVGKTLVGVDEIVSVV